jgi:hypothetical protein
MLLEEVVSYKPTKLEDKKEREDVKDKNVVSRWIRRQPVQGHHHNMISCSTKSVRQPSDRKFFSLLTASKVRRLRAATKALSRRSEGK